MSKGNLRSKTSHSRPNKLACGMTETWDRTKRGDLHSRFGSRLSDEALSMVVKGTTDKTGAGFQFRIKRVKDDRSCRCCGQAMPLLVRLNRSGRLRHDRMKNRARPLLRPAPRPLSWLVTAERLAL